MKVKCMECGLVLEKCLSLKCVCPECGGSSWYRFGHEVTMMELTMKARDKCDRENLERLKKLLEETYFLSKYWLEKNGYMYSEKMGVPNEDVKCDKDIGVEEAINFLKNIQYQGRNKDTFQIMEEIFKIIALLQQLKEMIPDMLRQINKDYRDFIERHLLMNLPIDPLDLSKLYQAQLERINNIKL